MKVFNYIVIGVVAAAIVVSFFVVGSPQQERLRQFDSRRTNDLNSIQWQILNYWQRKSQLPQNLEQLNDEISGFRVPKDPSTGVEYGYEVIGQNMFKLCADFALESEVSSIDMPKLAGIEENWSHGPGRTCFDRTIDPELYKPYPTSEPVPPVKF